MVRDQDDLIRHIGHHLDCVSYGHDDGDGGEMYCVAVECLDCNEVIVEFHVPNELDEKMIGLLGKFSDGFILMACESCGWSGSSDQIVELSSIPDFGMEFNSEMVPEGCCPECGSFVYKVGRPR